MPTGGFGGFERDAASAFQRLAILTRLVKLTPADLLKQR